MRHLALILHNTLRYTHRMSARELEHLVKELSEHTALRLLRVHRTTISRWIRGKSRIPDSALITLRAALYGERPGDVGKVWEGWSFGPDGMLYSPDGFPYSSGDLMAQRMERRLIKTLFKSVDELEAKVLALTRELAKHDIAANDMSVWPGNPQTKAYS